MEEVGFQNTALQNDSIGKSSKKPKRPLMWLIIAVIVLILIVAAVKFVGSKSKKSTANITPTPTEVPTSTNTPTPTLSTSPTSTSRPTTSPTSSAKSTANPIDRTTGLDRSKLSVAVENGSGAAGVAGKAADFLKSLGYDVVSTGNADNFNYTNVTVQVKSSQSDYLSLLKKDLSQNYTIGASSSDLSSSSSADALVIIGQ